MNLFENMNDSVVPTGMQWANVPSSWNFTEGQLLFEVSSGLDFFRDPKETFNKASAPFLYTVVEGDFILTTRVFAEMTAEYDSACLMILSDEKNWAKLCYEYVYQEPSIVSVVTRNTSDDCLSEKIGQVRPYLRIQRSGNAVGFHHSIDGKTWTMSRYFGMNLGTSLKVGVLGQCPLGHGTHVQFECLNLLNEPVSDVRITD